MRFRKLFQMLVLGGAALGLTSGCTGTARAQQPADAKPDGGDEKRSDDAGSAKASPPDAGSSGGGVLGW